MGIVIALIVLALIVGVLGIAIKGLLWLLAIAAILIIIGAALGFRARGTTDTRV
jgi:hypothetical protein